MYLHLPFGYFLHALKQCPILGTAEELHHPLPVVDGNEVAQGRHATAPARATEWQGSLFDVHLGVVVAHNQCHLREMAFVWRWQRWQRWRGDVFFSWGCRRNPSNWLIGQLALHFWRLPCLEEWMQTFHGLLEKDMLQPTGGRFLILYDIIKPSQAILVSKYRLKTPTNWENHLKPAESVWDVSAGNTFPICGKQNAPQKLTMHHPLFKALGAGFLHYDVV